MKRPLTFKYIILLCCACLVGWLAVNALILLLGRVPLWRYDAVSQYLNFFIWEGNVIRDSVGAFFAGEGFSLPMYTYNMGYGSDVLTAMANVVKDPLNILSAFCPQDYALFLFEALVIVRVALSALAFSYYCLSRDNSYSASFVASLCYAFCGYAVFWGMLRHPFFINTAILLPLILAGADRVFAHGRSALFVIALALQFFISIYFSYMVCIILFVYCLIKYFFLPRNRSLGDFLGLFVRFIVHILLAFSLGAVFALPPAINLLSLDRVSQDTFVPLFHSLGYYAKLPASLIGAQVNRRCFYVGAVALVFLAIFVLCPGRFTPQQRRPWLVGLAVIAVAALFPFFGHIMNGFGYATDRWMFIAGFCISYVVCLAFPHVGELSSSERKRVGVALALIIALGCITVVNYPFSTLGMVALSLMVCAYMLLVLPKMTWQKTTIALCALSLICVAGSTTLSYLPRGWANVNDFTTLETINAMINNGSSIQLAEEEAAGEPARVSLPRRSGAMKNASLNHDAMLIDYYSGFYNQKVDTFRTGLGISDEFFNYRFSGSDGRYAIDAFSGAQYFLASKSETWRVPYTYEKTGKKSSSYSLYQTAHALPLAFCTNKVIALEDYSRLTMVEKQEALLQGCVIDRSKISPTLTEVEAISSSQVIEATIEGGVDSKVEDSAFIILSKDAEITLSFEGEAGCETYLVFENLQLEGFPPSSIAREKGTDASSAKMFLRDLLYTHPQRATVSVTSKKRTKNLEFGTPRSQQYGGKTNWVLNLGYSEKPLTKMTVSFSEPGRYSFDSVKVMCQPLDTLVHYADELAASAADNLVLRKNHISASFSSGGLALFTIPFSSGWSATVDGKPAEIMQADVGFMALDLGENGQHQVELRYSTPGLAIGGALSLAGCIVFCIGTILIRSANRRRGRLVERD